MSNDKCKCSGVTNEYIDFLTNNYLSYDDMYRHMVNADTARRYQNTDEIQDIKDMIEDFVDDFTEDGMQEESEDMANELPEDFYAISNDDIDFDSLMEEYGDGGYDPYFMPIGANFEDSYYRDDMQNFFCPNPRNIEEDKFDDDIDYMKSMYPRAARKALRYIEAECDKLEYMGSCMFDEYPDYTNINRIVIRIYEKVKDMEGNKEDNKDREVEIKQHCDDRFCPYNRCIDCFEDGRPNWLYQMIQTLLFQEMINRRRRYRYRRWR